MKEKFVGISRVGEKGQIVIPKDIREMFEIRPGDSLILLADRAKGIAVLKAEALEGMTDALLGGEE